MVETAELFFALLAIAANVGTVVLLLARLGRHRWPAAGTLVDTFGRAQLGVATLIAVTATLGSLYFSEVANFEPCRLCWVQRIFMYPLAVILPIAAARRDRDARWYAVPLAVLGAAVALYHYLVERVPDLGSGGCSVTVPCTVPWFTEFGFVTLAYMALSGFLFIIVLLTLPAPQET